MSRVQNKNLLIETCVSSLNPLRATEMKFRRHKRFQGTDVRLKTRTVAFNLCSGRSSEAGLKGRSSGSTTGARRWIVTAKNVPVHIGFRTLGDCEIADADQERYLNGQIVRYVGIERLKNRVIVGTDAADLRLRANRMMELKMKVEEAGVRMLIIFLMLVKMLKRRLNERKRQQEGC